MTGYPDCDLKIENDAKEIWGGLVPPTTQTEHAVGKGKIIWGQNLYTNNVSELYPDYENTATILKQSGLVEDFTTNGAVRYTHRIINDKDVYFVANRSDEQINVTCSFRINKGSPEIWDPLNGKTKILPEFSSSNGQMAIPLQFEPYQSFFIVFNNDKVAPAVQTKNFPAKQQVALLDAPWTVSFNPTWGGPENIIFEQLTDWTKRPEDGIKYYSGTAIYTNRFDLKEAGNNKHFYLDLGEVKHMARVRVNGEDLGVVWTAPWHVNISGVVKQKNNTLEIEVANLWPNRLIGDQRLPDDGIKNGQWPDWLIKGEKRTSGRYTFTTNNPYKKTSPLITSGLLGPVTIQQTEF